MPIKHKEMAEQMTQRIATQRTQQYMYLNNAKSSISLAKPWQ